MADIQLEAFLIWEQNQHLSPEECWYRAEQVVNQKCNLDLHQSDCEASLDVKWGESPKIEPSFGEKKCCKGKKGCSNG